MHLNRSTTVTLAVLVSISVFGIGFVDSKENSNEILYSVFVALLVSCICYMGTEVITEIQRRKRIRNGLTKQYLSFKKSCIDLFLIASSSQNYDNRENLLEPNEFRRYFSLRVTDSQIQSGFSRYICRQRKLCIQRIGQRI